MAHGDGTGLNPASSTRRARVATGLLFLTNGALFANLIPRYPEIKAQLGMTDAIFGLSVAAFPLGAVIFGWLAARLIRRAGSGTVAVVMTIVLGVSLAMTAFMPQVSYFSLALLLAGGADALADVSQNTHGLRVQEAYGRSVLNSFHALWSLGSVLGGLMSAGALLIGMALRTHLVLSAVIFGAVALIAWTMTLPPTRSESVSADHTKTEAQTLRGEKLRVQRAVLRHPSTLGVVGALVLLAIAGAVVEDAGNSWSALYLSVHLGASSVVAALGFTALMAGQLLGRAIADRCVDRFGQRNVIRSGGAIIAIGMGTTLAFPTVPGTILGFAAAGLGAAPLMPAAYDRADSIPGLRPGVGLTVVSWLMRLGWLMTPPLVGVLSELFALRWALLVVPVVGVATIVLARVLPRRKMPKA